MKFCALIKSTMPTVRMHKMLLLRPGLIAVFASGCLSVICQLIIMSRPILKFQAEYGRPASVTLYAVRDFAGFSIVVDGFHSGITIVDGNSLSKFVTAASQKECWKPVVYSKFVDPRYGSSDCDQLRLESWLNGCHKLVERDSGDHDDAAVKLIHDFLDFTHAPHSYRCS